MKIRRWRQDVVSENEDLKVLAKNEINFFFNQKNQLQLFWRCSPVILASGLQISVTRMLQRVSEVCLRRVFCRFVQSLWICERPHTMRELIPARKCLLRGSFDANLAVTHLVFPSEGLAFQPGSFAVAPFWSKWDALLSFCSALFCAEGCCSAMSWSKAAPNLLMSFCNKVTAKPVNFCGPPGNRCRSETQ